MVSMLATAWRVAPAAATTVRPGLETCPICQKKFVISVLCSYNSFGERARDLSDTVFRFGGLRTCPYCLYTALECDFAKISKQACTRVRQALKSMRESPPEAHIRHAKRIPQDFLADCSLQAGIARACYEKREFSQCSRIRLAMFEYFRSKSSDEEARLAGYREKAIHVITTAVESGDLPAGEKGMYIYLKGELLRQAGLDRQALSCFGAAKTIIEGLPGDLEPDANFGWVANWATEQSYLIEFRPRDAAYLETQLADLPPMNGCSIDASPKLRACLGTLRSRKDGAAKEVLDRYAERSADNAMWPLLFGMPALDADSCDTPPADLLAGLAEMLETPLLRQYTLEEGEWPSNLAKKFGVNVRRLEELNPEPGGIVGKGPGTSLWIPNLPDGLTEARVFEALPRLITSAEPAAMRWLLKWAGGQRQFGSLSSEFGRCLKALHQARSLWPLAESRIYESAMGEAPVLLDCIAYVCELGEATPGMMNSVRLEWSPIAIESPALACLSLKRDTVLREKALTKLEIALKSKGTYGLLSLSGSLEYLAAVGSEAETARLSAIALKLVDKDDGGSPGKFGYSRRYLESCIRSINLRTAFCSRDNTQGTKAPR